MANKYVSFIGSLLFDQLVPDPSEEQKQEILHLTEKYCRVAREFGSKLTERGHFVKVGSFSELDLHFADGAVNGAKQGGYVVQERVIQILGGFTDQRYLHTETAHVPVPMDDDFISGRSAFISHAKSIVLLGGHHYAKMLASWAHNIGIPVFALPQGHLAGMEFWKYLVADGHNNDKPYEVYPGIAREDYERIGIMNGDPEWLATKLFELIEKSSKHWVKPSILPDEMRYRPRTNQVLIHTAFVAMSFSPEKEAVYRAISDACEAAGFRAFRGDSKNFYHQDLSIMSNVMDSIVRSHVVIVDLSDRNPNVFYEMGVADTLGKPMILLFDGKGDVPFDVSGLRHLRYKTDALEAITEPLVDILRGFIT